MIAARSRRRSRHLGKRKYCAKGADTDDLIPSFKRAASTAQRIRLGLFRNPAAAQHTAEQISSARMSGRGPAAQRKGSAWDVRAALRSRSKRRRRSSSSSSSSSSSGGSSSS
eukprot:10314662-Heterocapsa_arctica.AAC.1